MAIPKRLKEIPESKALKIIDKHTKDGDGEWESTPWRSDFVYEGQMTKYGHRRYEMIRVDKYAGLPAKYEQGPVSL